MSSSMQSSFLAPLTKLARSVGERGWKGTWTQLYLIGDIKFGTLRGTDNFGNKYYENLDLPFGQHRWVEYSNIHNPDATMIQPEWHGWMHHMFDETPEEFQEQKELLATTTVTHAIYDTHIGHINQLDAKETVDTSQYRSRGYGTGSLHTEIGEPDHYYKQPGHPLSGNDAGRFKNRKDITNEFDPNAVVADK
jgi:NADH:ubiquinone oxidoreductase subunit